VSEKVFDEMVCPECGGSLAGGDKPCRCFAASKKPAAPDSPPPEPVPGPGAKLCRVCGKDLTGRSRMKDADGYLCKPCADVLDAAEQGDPDAMKCPECKRRLKPAAFVEYRGTLICKRCKMHHDETDGLKVAKVELTQHREHDKQKLIRMGILIGVLMLLAIMSLIRSALR
jgi:uncharacterized protein YbaR (Trm112 family)